MCIAILNTKGLISKKTLKNCWENNPDGAGLAYPEAGAMKTYKELKDFKSFYKHYADVRTRLPDNVNMLIHFRIATHGKINETNCHPFLINKNTAFIHNGVISNSKMGTSPDFSDTYLFNQTILKKLQSNFIANEAILNLLASYIGGSKLVFLNGNNEWSIVNEKSGIWDKDNWFSNTSYEEDMYYGCYMGDYGYKKSNNKTTTQFGSKYGNNDYAQGWEYDELNGWSEKAKEKEDTYWDYCRECYTPIATNDCLCIDCKTTALDAGLTLNQIEEFYDTNDRYDNKNPSIFGND